MDSGRRMFLGSAAAVGVGSGLTALDVNAFFLQDTASHPHANARDAVFEELVGQLRGAVKGLHDKPGETLRRVAGTLRLAAVHARDQGLDAQFQARLRDHIAANGRDALLAAEVTPEQLEAEARSFGVPVPALPALVSVKARERMLNEVLSEGFTGRMVKVANSFVLAARRADAAGPSLRAVAARQCEQLAEMEQWITWLMTAFCSIQSLFGFLFALYGCAFFFGAWVAATGLQWLWC